MVYFPQLTSEVRAFGQFRKVLHTGLFSQLVSMEIPVGGDIGDEVHTVDQVLIFTSGEGKATVAGKDQVTFQLIFGKAKHYWHCSQDIKASDVVVVPAGTQHQFINTSKTQPLELVTVYSPAEHDSRTVHKTKEEGDEEEENGKDEAPEWSQQSKEYNEKHGLVKESGGPYENGDDGRHQKSWGGGGGSGDCKIRTINVIVRTEETIMRRTKSRCRIW
jgi:mannose-6-phosphate isomerase-like protein (cupin superfamily)